jgi:hypothetical protein
MRIYTCIYIYIYTYVHIYIYIYIYIYMYVLEGYGDSEAHVSTENDLSSEPASIPLSKSLQKQEEKRYLYIRL